MSTTRVHLPLSGACRSANAILEYYHGVRLGVVDVRDMRLVVGAVLTALLDTVHPAPLQEAVHAGETHEETTQLRLDAVNP